MTTKDARSVMRKRLNNEAKIDAARRGAKAPATTAIQALNKDVMKLLRAEINAALGEVASRHGMRSLVAVHNSTFDPSIGSFVFRIEGVIGTGKSQEEARYENAASHDLAMKAAKIETLDPLPPLGTKFRHGSDEYLILGLNSTGTKVSVRHLFNQKAYWFKAHALRGLYRMNPKHFTLPGGAT